MANWERAQAPESLVPNGDVTRFEAAAERVLAGLVPWARACRPNSRISEPAFLFQ
jgi:hypothetical protein